MSHTNCRSRKTSKRALNGAHRMSAPRGELANFDPWVEPKRSMGAVAMSIVANMLRFGSRNR